MTISVEKDQTKKLPSGRNKTEVRLIIRMVIDFRIKIEMTIKEVIEIQTQGIPIGETIDLVKIRTKKKLIIDKIKGTKTLKLFMSPKIPIPKIKRQKAPTYPKKMIPNYFMCQNKIMTKLDKINSKKRTMRRRLYTKLKPILHIKLLRKLWRSKLKK